jgi:hypothetical protein
MRQHNDYVLGCYQIDYALGHGADPWLSFRALGPDHNEGDSESYLPIFAQYSKVTAHSKDGIKVIESLDTTNEAFEVASVHLEKPSRKGATTTLISIYTYPHARTIRVTVNVFNAPRLPKVDIQAMTQEQIQGLAFRTQEIVHSVEIFEVKYVSTLSGH